MDISKEFLEIDLYEYLECDPSAKDHEIKSAFRKKALSCHPDKHPNNPNAAEMFKKLKSITELLMDKYKRAIYDRQYEANRRKAQSQKRAKEERCRLQRAQEKAEEEAKRQQKAEEEFARQQRADLKSYRKQRAVLETERLLRAQDPPKESHSASYRDTGAPQFTSQQRRVFEKMAAAFAAMNSTQQEKNQDQAEKKQEQAKKNGMGHSKQPPASSHPNPKTSFHPRYTSSTLNPNSPVFYPRTIPGQTV